MKKYLKSDLNVALAVEIKIMREEQKSIQKRQPFAHITNRSKDQINKP